MQRKFLLVKGRTDHGKEYWHWVNTDMITYVTEMGRDSIGNNHGGLTIHLSDGNSITVLAEDNDGNELVKEIENIVR